MVLYAHGDSELAQKIVDGDNEIDDLEIRIDEEAIRYLSLRAPIATELRVLVTGMKVSQNFERAGDEITKIARRIRNISSDAPIKLKSDIVQMGELAASMLNDVRYTESGSASTMAGAAECPCSKVT